MTAGEPLVTGGAAVSRLRLVVGGHVDHGKSTVVGRLLAETGSLPEGRIERVRATCERTGVPFEWAFLLDALRDEQRQGITIEAARVFLRTPQRQVLLFDAPGHAEFLRNMVTGAAQADAALLVLDAQEGVRENSIRHAVLMQLLGIRELAVLVNKMDLVDFDRGVFDAVLDSMRQALDPLGVRVAAAIPVSGREGSNLATREARMPWYRGPTVVEQIDRFTPEPAAVRQPLRMPVQDVYRFPRGGDTRRIVAGTVESGTLRVGDEVVFHPSGKRTRVETIEAFHRVQPIVAAAGEAAGFTMSEQVYVPRGEVVARAGEPVPQVGTRFLVRLFWLGLQPLAPDREYLLKLGTARTVMRVDRVIRVVNAATLAVELGRTQVDRHEVGEAVLVTEKPIAWDPPEVCLATSRFVIQEEYTIVGGGLIQAPLAPGELAVVVTPRRRSA